MAFWKALLKKEEFINLFTDLVSSFRVPDHITQGLEKFVCTLYGNHPLSSANEMCYKMFVQKFDNKKKMLYLSLSPPCQTNLELHIERANYLAMVYR